MSIQHWFCQCSSNPFFALRQTPNHPVKIPRLIAGDGGAVVPDGNDTVIFGAKLDDPEAEGGGFATAKDTSERMVEAQSPVGVSWRIVILQTWAKVMTKLGGYQSTRTG